MDKSHHLSRSVQAGSGCLLMSHSRYPLARASVLPCTLTVAGPGMQVTSRPLLWGSEEKPCCRMITFSGIPQGHCSRRRQVNDPPHSYLYDKEFYRCTLQPALILPLSSPAYFKVTWLAFVGHLWVVGGLHRAGENA